LVADYCDKRATKNIEEAMMLKHVMTAVGALAALALTTTSGAAFGFPTGQRLHTPFPRIAAPAPRPSITDTIIDGYASRVSHAGSPRDPATGQATGKRHYKPVEFSPALGTIPLGQVRFRVDSPPMTPIGGAQTGRVTGIAVDPSDPVVRRGPRLRAKPTAMHFGAANGGAWKARNGGTIGFPVHREIFTTLRRGAAKPSAHIPTYVHVIRNGRGTMGMFRRAPAMRWR
jgi:hypothetical protein